MKRFVVLALLILIAPLSIREPLLAVTTTPMTVEPSVHPTFAQSLEGFKEMIRSHGQRLEDQGVLVESLDGQDFAEHNANIAFNPASVMKLATSLVALSKLGPDFRFRTNFLADGAVDQASHRLVGDLVVEGGTAPMFVTVDAESVAAQLVRLGISHVTGSLKIAGAFYYFATGYHLNLSRETSAAKLRQALQRGGIRIDGATCFGAKSGTLLVSHYSDELMRILLYQNAHSSNAIAEVVGESVGGPQAIQNFLLEDVGLRESEIYVGRASGLEINRITPRASLVVLRRLIDLLTERGLKPEDVMAVAGIDSGTLRGRLAGDVRGSVVAKTGTLVSVDNGVSTLVGIAYTRADGPLLFAVFNSGGNVHTYRKSQDQFLQAFIEEAGGGAGARRNQDALAEMAHDSIVQVLYRQRTEQPSTQAE